MRPARAGARGQGDAGRAKEAGCSLSWVGWTLLALSFAFAGWACVRIAGGNGKDEGE